MKKRLLSLLLCICLVTALLPMTASAAESYATWTDAGSAAREDKDYALDAGGNYTIYTAKGLARLANVVNGGDDLAGKKVTLANDIDLLEGGVTGYAKGTLTESNSWVPIGIMIDGSTESGFAGTFDGAGYSISNLFMKITSKSAGLFGVIVNAAVENVNIVGADITAGNYVADAILVAFAQDSTIADCSVDETSVITGSNRYYFGGVVGYIGSAAVSSVVKNCVNNATVTDTSASYIGGIAGTTAGTNVKIQNCVNNGPISGYDGLGGIVGHTSDGDVLEISGCINTGVIVGVDGMVGGIGGCLESAGITVSKCYNSGAITGKYEVGGIVGNSFGTSVLNCYNTGTVRGTRTTSVQYCSVGGIVGKLITRSLTSSVSLCHNFGYVFNDGDYTDYVGTIVGKNEASSVTSCAYIEGFNPVGTGVLSTGTATTLNGYSYEQFADGTVLAFLNGEPSSDIWKQNTQVDNYPTFAYKYGITVAGVAVTDDNKDDVLDDGTVSYDPDTNTLTLNNAQIAYTSASSDAAIDAEGDLTVLLKGASNIQATGEGISGIYVYDGNLTIRAEQDGSLSVIAVDVEGDALSGIYAGDAVNFQSGDVIVNTDGMAVIAGVEITVSDDHTVSGSLTENDQNPTEANVDTTEGFFSFFVGTPGMDTVVKSLHIITKIPASDPGNGQHFNPGIYDQALPYDDVLIGDMMYDAVKYAYMEGWMVGVAPNQFGPDLTLSRAMTWTILARMNGVSTETWANQPWYYTAQQWCMAQGITDGTDPNGAVTKLELITMLWRNAGKPMAALDIDVSAVPEWGVEAWRWAIENDLISGDWKQPATRGETATALYQM